MLWRCKKHAAVMLNDAIDMLWRCYSGAAAMPLSCFEHPVNTLELSYRDAEFMCRWTGGDAEIMP